MMVVAEAKLGAAGAAAASKAAAVKVSPGGSSRVTCTSGLGFTAESLSLETGIAAVKGEAMALGSRDSLPLLLQAHCPCYIA